jgi:phage gp45-like
MRHETLAPPPPTPDNGPGSTGPWFVPDPAAAGPNTVTAPAPNPEPAATPNTLSSRLPLSAIETGAPVSKSKDALVILNQAGGSLVGVFEGMGKKPGNRKHAARGAKTVSDAIAEQYQKRLHQPTSDEEALLDMKTAFLNARKASQDDKGKGASAATVAKVENIEGVRKVVWGTTGRGVYIKKADGSMRQLSADQDPADNLMDGGSPRYLDQFGIIELADDEQIVLSPETQEVKEHKHLKIESAFAKDQTKPESRNSVLGNVDRNIYGIVGKAETTDEQTVTGEDAHNVNAQAQRLLVEHDEEPPVDLREAKWRMASAMTAIAPEMKDEGLVGTFFRVQEIDKVTYGIWGRPVDTDEGRMLIQNEDREFEEVTLADATIQDGIAVGAVVLDRGDRIAIASGHMLHEDSMSNDEIISAFEGDPQQSSQKFISLNHSTDPNKDVVVLRISETIDREVIATNQLNRRKTAAGRGAAAMLLPRLRRN